MGRAVWRVVYEVPDACVFYRLPLKLNETWSSSLWSEHQDQWLDHPVYSWMHCHSTRGVVKYLRRHNNTYLFIFYSISSYKISHTYHILDLDDLNILESEDETTVSNQYDYSSWFFTLQSFDSGSPTVKENIFDSKIVAYSRVGPETFDIKNAKNLNRCWYRQWKCLSALCVNCQKAHHYPNCPN